VTGGWVAGGWVTGGWVTGGWVTRGWVTGAAVGNGCGTALAVVGGTVDSAVVGAAALGLATVVGAGVTSVVETTPVETGPMVVTDASATRPFADVDAEVDPQPATSPTIMTPARIRSRTAIGFPSRAPACQGRHPDSSAGPLNSPMEKGDQGRYAPFAGYH
jgi:hypothetical protein